MSKYFYEQSANCKNGEEVVATYGVKDDAIVRIITPDSEMKWGFLVDKEVPDWETRWVHLRYSPKMGDYVGSELKIFKESHPKSELVALAQDFVVHLFCKGLRNEEVEELSKNLQRYNW